MSNELAHALSLDWEREIPTLYLVADLDTVLPLHAVPTAVMDNATGDHAVAADIDVLVDHDHRRPVVKSRYCRCESGRSGSDGDNRQQRYQHDAGGEPVSSNQRRMRPSDPASLPETPC